MAKTAVFTSNEGIQCEKKRETISNSCKISDQSKIGI